MPCMCGDTACPSCGPAQGNTICEWCGNWADDHTDRSWSVHQYLARWRWRWNRLLIRLGFCRASRLEGGPYDCMCRSCRAWVDFHDKENF